MTDITRINERMPVISADGRAIGVVRRAVGTEIRVTSEKDGSAFEHVIPLDWVSEVGRYVFLNKSSTYVAANWEAAGAGRARAA